MWFFLGWDLVFLFVFWALIVFLVVGWGLFGAVLRALECCLACVSMLVGVRFGMLFESVAVCLKCRKFFFELG